MLNKCTNYLTLLVNERSRYTIIIIDVLVIMVIMTCAMLEQDFVLKDKGFKIKYLINKQLPEVIVKDVLG